jgi:hypothetical protein
MRGGIGLRRSETILDFGASVLSNIPQKGHM